MMEKWTMKNILTGKTRPVIILTIILTIVFNKLFNQLMTREVIVEGGLYSSYTNHFSIGIYGAVFAIPAGFISILIVKFFMNIKKGKPDSFDDERKFKWYSIYGTVCGFVILFLLANLNSTLADQMEISNVWDGFKWAFAVIIIPVVIAVISAKLLNKVMIRITNTNGKLIEAIQSGRYDAEFSNMDDKNRVLKLLEKGNVSSIKGGLWFLRIRDFTIIVVGGIIFAMFFLLDKVTPTIGQRGRGGGWDYRQSKLYQERQRLKSEANYTAEQKRKQADYSRRMYVKQANYNAKYSQQEWNRAVHDEKAYQEAKRNADRL